MNKVWSILESEILPTISKPSRYLGNEINSVHKDKDAVDVRIALVFPDLYDLGLGNLGLHILYAIVNNLEWAWCERAYAPGLDMEEALKAHDVPLFALESKDPLTAFDGVGITLQSELTYTNILNILELSRIPLRTCDRTDEHPLTFAGGPAVFNPEPLAPFMDFFVIGDGEDVMLEIAELFRTLRGQTRQARLEAFAKLEGVYVPALYPFETLPDGRVLPVEGTPKIKKRLTRDLNGATFPTNYIVPFTTQIYDRISLEVLRGCTQGCRFCAAGMTTRPVRERKIEKIDELMERTLKNTGYEEVSLVSLSTCDYSDVQRMVQAASDRASSERAAVSLPSLRLDSFSVGLADMVAQTRRSGITFAPEAASPRLRAVINKWIPDEELLKMSAGAYELGWEVIKLYFMIGLPTERDDDIEAIGDLAIRTWEAGRKIQRKARVNLGVSTFVPKPFTPFQWAEQIGMDETNRRQDLLLSRIKRVRNIKFGRHEAVETWIEGLITRADRRGADLIEAAYRNGARFDGWSEHVNQEAWEKAVEETGFDVAEALRERDVTERLPWDHIDVLIDKSWLAEDWERALELKWAQDCRHRKCHDCGVIDKERELCASMLRDNVQARLRERKDPFVPPAKTERQPEPPIVQRLWIRYARTGTARFLGNLEARNSWVRVLRRARAPMRYKLGFHPRPWIAFSDAVPSGRETLGDYIDLRLVERVDPIELLSRIRATLPEGFQVLAINEVYRKAPALMDIAKGNRYTVYFPHMDRPALAARLLQLHAMESIPHEIRKSKRDPRMITIDVKPTIHTARIIKTSEVSAIELILGTTHNKTVRPEVVLPLFTDDVDRVQVVKEDCLYERDGVWRSVGEWVPEEEPPVVVTEESAQPAVGS